MSIKFNKHGLNVNNIISDNIIASDGSKFLNENESNLKYIRSSIPQTYNWTPDWKNNVRGIDVVSFETPVNGWLSINKSNSPILINGKQITTLPSSGSYQGMLKFGDVVTSSSEFSYTFAPCKSEMLDWREVPTDYDIWRGAIFRNDDGSVESRDLYIPDASSWRYLVNNNGLTITKVEDDKAYNSDEFVCNMQTEKIKRGYSAFYQFSNLTTFTSDLSSLTDGERMFMYCENLTTFTGDLSSLTNGERMFMYCENLTTFTGDLSSLTNGYQMFCECHKLTSFTSDLSSLTDGGMMFDDCESLTTFTSDLSSLTNGSMMFYNCNLDYDSIRHISETIRDVSSFDERPTLNIGNYDLEATNFVVDIMKKGWDIGSNAIKTPSFFSSAVSVIDNNFYNSSNELIGTYDTSTIILGKELFYKTKRVITTFDSDLSSLTDGWMMFYECRNLTTFTSDLSSITQAYQMFRTCPNLTTFTTSDLNSLTDGGSMFRDCTNLTTFTYDLNSLTNGKWMFRGCSKLTSFTSDLSSLTDGTLMFENCKLDAASIERILTTIPTYTSGSYSLYLGIQSAAASKFAEITGTTPTTTEQSVSYKGWTISVKINS